MLHSNVGQRFIISITSVDRVTKGNQEPP